MGVKIVVFYLPSYSQELKAAELLNADLKQRVAQSAPARTKTARKRTPIGTLRNIQKQPTYRQLLPERGIESRRCVVMPQGLIDKLPICGRK